MNEKCLLIQKYAVVSPVSNKLKCVRLLWTERKCLDYVNIADTKVSVGTEKMCDVSVELVYLVRR